MAKYRIVERNGLYSVEYRTIFGNWNCLFDDTGYGTDEWFLSFEEAERRLKYYLDPPKKKVLVEYDG